jgi:hypothetical protein
MPLCDMLTGEHAQLFVLLNQEKVLPFIQIRLTSVTQLVFVLLEEEGEEKEVMPIKVLLAVQNCSMSSD